MEETIPNVVHPMLAKSPSASQVIRLCYLAFFLSGAAALIYEASWARQIGVVIGHTASASSVVLAGIFLGMAIGYGIGARIAKAGSPLMAYCAAELIIAAWAFVVPAILGLADWLPVLKLLSHPIAGVQFAIRCLFCGGALLPATIALGVTLPAISEFLRNERIDRARRTIVAYAWNTTGASVGMLWGSFYLMSHVGVRGCSYVAAGLSVAAGLLAVGVSLSTGVGIGVLQDRSPIGTDANPRFDENLWVSSIFAAAIGFGTLALQILYLRLFALVFHNSTYTFAAVVAVFLVALALGARLASWLAMRCETKKLVGWTAAACAALIPASACAFVAITGLEYFTAGQSFSSYLVAAILLVAAIVLVPVIPLGMFLPVLWATPNGQRDRTRHISRLTMINTVGSAIGAVSAHLLIAPTLGLWNAFLAVGLIFGGLSIFTFMLCHRARFAIVVVSVTATAVGASHWYLIQWVQPRSLEQEIILRRWESSYGWIDVIEDQQTSERKVRQNLHYRLGSTGNRAIRERRQAAIPLLLHDKPENVLFLGSGTGVTASGALMCDDVRRVTIVELIPEVIAAARLLADENLNVLDDPKVTVEIDDARHFLRRTEDKYDVIVSDLFVPWESKSGYLYTVEQYQLVRAHLAPRGLFCQWLPVYQLGTGDLETIVDSFANVFPSTTLWWGQLDSNRPILGIVGSDLPLRINREQLRKRLPKMRFREPDPLVSSESVFLNLVAGDWRNCGSQLNTDEFPRIEFQAPVSQADQKLLSGSTFEKYYESRLLHLDDKAFEENGKGERRVMQQLLLFSK